MATIHMHISDEKDYEFKAQPLTDSHTLDIHGDGVHLAIFITKGQLLELSNEIVLYLATQKLKAEQATDASKEDEVTLKFKQGDRVISEISGFDKINGTVESLYPNNLARPYVVRIDNNHKLQACKESELRRIDPDDEETI